MDDDNAREGVETLDSRSGVPHDPIGAQLYRILSSPEFHATDKMRAGGACRR